jgi:predicted dehydrogenase
MDRLRVGIVGLGVGERHLVGYRSIPGVEVVAVCDIDEARLHEVADRHGVERRTTDYRTITEADDIDVVSICSYDDVHAEQAISAFRHGKHVMVEKPVALRREDAEALLEAQQASGRFISSNLILRASPRFREVKRMVDAGELGEVFYLEGDYLHDILHKITEGWRGRMGFYCVTYGGGIHLIDLMRWILGAEVDEVVGMGTGILTRGTPYRFPDTIVNLLRFDTGAVAKTTTCYGPRRPKFHALDVYGTAATFSNDVPHGRLWTSDRPEDLREVTSAYPGMEKGDLLPEFVAAIRAGVEPEVGAVDVFRVLDVCLAAWESVERGAPVKVSYLL